MTKDTEAAADRIIAFCDKWERGTFNGDDIHCIGTGDGGQICLTVADLRALATPSTTPDTIGSHFGNGGGLDPAAGEVGPVEYGDAAQDAVMRLLERGVATVNSDGYLVLAHPPHPAPVDPVAGGEALRVRDILQQILDMEPTEMVKSPSFVRSLVREALAALKEPAA